jgi:hypothetical protein
MSLSCAVLALALGVTGDVEATPRAARLVEGNLRLALMQTPPPLVDAPPEQDDGPPSTPGPPRDRERLTPPLDRYANSVNLLEVAAVGGSLLLLDVVTVVAVFLFAVIASSLDDFGGAVVAILGIGTVLLGNVLGTPLLAALMAGMAAPSGYRAGGTYKSTLYAGVTHGALLVGWVILSLLAPSAGDSGGLLGVVALGMLAARYVGIGVAASWGLHSGPASPLPPKKRTRGTGKPPPANPSELALAERRAGAVSLLALSF